MWNRRAAFLVMIAILGGPAAAETQSEWVRADASGKLAYKATAAGDRIPDFSTAGYGGGGVKLPDPPVVKTVTPSGKGDDSTTIQAAVDEVARRELAGGLRGAVLLGPGVFQCEQTINLKASGVVLRGSGSAESGGTTLRLTGKPHAAIVIAGTGKVAESGKGVAITDAYVAAGSTRVHVADAAPFKAGDVVVVAKPVTPQWVEFMGMNALVRNGKAQTWVGRGPINTERRIAAVAGTVLTLDVPLTDSIDAKYKPGATVTRATPPERVTQVGVEALRIVSPPQAVGIDEPHHQAVRADVAADVWLRDLQVVDTVNSIRFGHECRRVTAERVTITHTVATKGAAKPADFACDGSQVLIDRCAAGGDNLFYFATGGRVSGPIVLLDCTFHGNGHVQPHMRWATGLLVDRCQAPEGGIDFMNRGIYGSGHGWTIGWSVAWNCVAKTYVIQNPPGTMNWAIGCRGEQLTAPVPGGTAEKLPLGTVEAANAPVTPASLYLAQLKERVGDEGLHNIGR